MCFLEGGRALSYLPRRSSSQGGRGRGYYYLLIFCKAGGGGKYYCLGARWADGEGGGGKIIMIDFLKGGEGIILFAEKEFKPEGRGRGGHYFYCFLQGHHFGRE